MRSSRSPRRMFITHIYTGCLVDPLIYFNATPVDVIAKVTTIFWLKSPFHPTSCSESQSMVILYRSSDLATGSCFHLLHQYSNNLEDREASVKVIAELLGGAFLTRHVGWPSTPHVYTTHLNC